MITRIRLNALVLITSTFIVLATITSSSTKMFGKFYDSKKDYSCCKNDQLYIFHNYSSYIFWVKTNEKFEAEAVGKPTPGECNVQCLNSAK